MLANNCHFSTLHSGMSVLSHGVSCLTTLSIAKTTQPFSLSVLGVSDSDLRVCSHSPRIADAFRHSYESLNSCYPLEIPAYFINPLNPELNPICYLLALLGAHHFLHVSRIRVRLLSFMLLMSYIYGAPILDVSRSHTTTQHSR